MSRPKPRRQAQTRKKLLDQKAEHRRWLAHAEAMASTSPHPTVKVGAVLIGRTGTMIASSPNRFAHGVDDSRKERFRDGVKSLWINCAEQIAITEALRKCTDVKGATFYLTLEPCAVCAGMMAELRIHEVFVPVDAMRRYARLKTKWKKSIEVGVIKLAEAGINLTAIDPKPRSGNLKRRR